MTPFLSRLFNIQSHEWPRLLMLYAMFFLFMVGTVWGGTVIEATFLTQVGLEFLPVAFVVEAIITGIAVGIYSAFVDRVPNDRLLLMILLVGIGVLLIGQVILAAGYETLGIPVLYLFYLVIANLFPLQWWNYIDEFYDTITAKRAVPIIASALQVGTIFAGLTLPLLNAVIHPNNVAYAWVFALIGVMALVTYFPRLVKDDVAGNIQARTTEKMPYIKSMREGVSYIRHSRFLLWMAANTLFLTIMVAMVGYQSNKILLEQLETTEALSNFVGRLLSVANLIMLPVQVFVFSRIVSRIGVEDTNLIYPVGTLGVIGGLILMPTRVLIGALGIFDRTAFRKTFQTPVEILMYNTIPLRLKGRIGAVIAGAVQPAGTLFAGILLLTFLPLVVARWQMAVLMGGIALAYFLISIILRYQYTHALLETLEQEDFSFLLQQSAEVNIVDSKMIDMLAIKFREAKTEELKLFIGQLLVQVSGNDAVDILGADIREGALRIRRGLLDIFVTLNVRSDAVGVLYRDLLQDSDAEIRRSALEGLEFLLTPHNQRFLNEGLRILKEDEALIVRAQVMPALISSGDIFYVGTAFHQLSNLLDSDDSKARVTAVRILQRIDDVRLIRNLIDVMDHDEDDEVRLATAMAMEHLAQFEIPEWMHEDILQEIDYLITDRVERIRQTAITIIERLNITTGYERLFIAVDDESKIIRQMAARVMAKSGEGLRDNLMLLQRAGTVTQQKFAWTALVQMERDAFHPMLNTYLRRDLDIIYLNHGYLATLEQYFKLPGVSVLRQMLEDQNANLLEDIYYFLSVVHGEKTVRTIVNNMDSFDLRPFAVEALESMTQNPTLTKLIAGLYEDISYAARCQLNAGDIPTLEQTLDLFTDPETQIWWRMVATFVMGELHQKLEPELRDTILERGLTSDNPDLLRASHAAQCLIDPTQPLHFINLAKEETVLSSLEKVIFLKQVPLFNGLSVDELRLVAGICEEHIFENNELLFKQGDAGDAMYIIVNGKLAVEIESPQSGNITRLAVRSAYEFIGEMALFDKSPRSADVRAIQDTLTLRLEDTAFLQLTRQTPDLALAIIRVLSTRIRESAAQIAEMQKGKNKEVLNVYDRLGDLADEN